MVRVTCNFSGEPKSSDDCPPNAVPTFQSCFRTLLSGFSIQELLHRGLSLLKAELSNFAGYGGVGLLNYAQHCPMDIRLLANFILDER